MYSRLSGDRSTCPLGKVGEEELVIGGVASKTSALKRYQYRQMHQNRTEGDICQRGINAGRRGGPSTRVQARSLITERRFDDDGTRSASSQSGRRQGSSF